MKHQLRVFQIVVALTTILIVGNTGAQSVAINTISGSHFCAGDTISVTFTATGSWRAGNAFILQLSDPTGSFSNGFRNIGSLVDTLPGTFTIDTTIWARSSTHYRFRILAASPYITSA